MKKFGILTKGQFIHKLIFLFVISNILCARRRGSYHNDASKNKTQRRDHPFHAGINQGHNQQWYAESSVNGVITPQNQQWNAPQSSTYRQTPHSDQSTRSSSHNQQWHVPYYEPRKQMSHSDQSTLSSPHNQQWHTPQSISYPPMSLLDQSTLSSPHNQQWHTPQSVSYPQMSHSDQSARNLSHNQQWHVPSYETDTEMTLSDQLAMIDFSYKESPAFIEIVTNILDTLFQIFLTLDEFVYIKEILLSSENDFVKEFAMLMYGSLSKEDRKIRLTYFYHNFIKKSHFYYRNLHIYFIEYFLALITACNIHHKYWDIDSDHKISSDKNLNNLFITKGYFNTDFRKPYRKPFPRYFYNRNFNPVFTKEGLLLQYKFFSHDISSKIQENVLSDKICKILVYSKYLIFDAKKNLRFFFIYFKNKNFDIKFYEKSYSLIGFVLSDQGYSYFMINNDMITFNENEEKLTMKWPDFQNKNGRKYEKKNVIVILKMN